MAKRKYKVGFSNIKVGDIIYITNEAQTRLLVRVVVDVDKKGQLYVSTRRSNRCKYINRDRVRIVQPIIF